MPAVQSSPASAMAEVQASRYETDFEEKRTLGAGGFGTVVLAINRYDGIAYAIKKVVIRGLRLLLWAVFADLGRMGRTYKFRAACRGCRVERHTSVQSVSSPR